MKRNLVSVVAGVCFGTCCVFAGQKIDISAVITKSDAEKALSVPVKDPKGRNKEGADGFYDSEWSYYALNGDKALVFDLVIGGRDAPPNLTKTMFSILPPEGGKSTKVDGLGDKAVFYHDKTGLEMLSILKDEILITIGIRGLPASAALEREKSLATKILAQL
jgi:hypothetical protein